MGKVTRLKRIVYLVVFVYLRRAAAILSPAVIGYHFA